MIEIVFLQRGQVVVGEFRKLGSDVQIERAAVVTHWGTRDGIGELALKGPQRDSSRRSRPTRLNYCGTVRAPDLGVVMRVECDQAIWAPVLETRCQGWAG